MSLSEIIIKIVGIILVVVGLGVLLAAVGINFIGTGIVAPWYVDVIVGVLFMGAGIWIIRGGSISL